MSSLSRVVGLTGGIGCGKTTVLQEFRNLGVPCFVADEASRRCYDDPGFRSVVADRFGAGRVILPDGSVDRRAVADIVFRDPDQLRWLNGEVHPRVMADFDRWRSSQVAPYVILESAILYEAHLDARVDLVVAVYLEREERLRRLELRDHASREALEARMRNQLSAEEKMDRADFVVLNYEGNPRARQVRYVHGQIVNV